MKLSEIIKKSCYINCDTNVQLKLISESIDLPKSIAQKRFGMGKEDNHILLMDGTYSTFPNPNTYHATIYHISSIDLTS
jgi:hypothetical protein